MKKLFLLLMLSFLLSPLYLSATIFDGIEAFYQFDWSDEDWTGNHHGQDPGAGYSYGLFGAAADFNGISDYAQLADFNPYDTGDNDAASIAFWVKPEYDTTNHCYIGKHTSTGGNIFLFGYWSGKLHLRIKNSTVDISTDAEVTNEWMHYAITMWDENNTSTFVTVYRDGEEIFYGSLNDSLDNMDGKPWVVGMEWDGSNPSDHFKGQIDHLLFYNRILTETEVRDLVTMPSISNNLTAHFKLDDDVVDSDSSWGTFTGTAYNIDWKVGHEGKSSYFDDDPDANPHIDNYIELGSAFTDPRFGGKMWSVSMWVNPEENNNHTYLAQNTNTGGNIFFFGVWNSGLQINFGGNTGFLFSEFNDSEEIGVWSHYVLNFLEPSIYPGYTRITVFKDGVKRGEKWLQAVLPPNLSTINSRPWLLGMEYDTNTKSDFFRGEIDHVRFYNKTLSEEAVEELYLMDYGVRVCSGSYLDGTCRTYNDTDYNLGENDDEWWVKETVSYYPYYQWVKRRVNDDIESFHVYNGWEAYVCQHSNHNGLCDYISGGETGEKAFHYDFPNVGTNAISSLTVQPNSFHWARKLFPFEELEDGSGYYGYAYLYEYENYQGKRLFLNELTDGLDLTNTIIKDETSSIELWGDVVATVCKDTGYNGDCKVVPTTQRGFNFLWAEYSWTYFSGYDNNIESVFLSYAPSFGMFISNDSAMDAEGENDHAIRTCLTGPSEIEGRIECYRHGTDMNPSEALDLDEFRDRIRDNTSGGSDSARRKFEKYADSYDILWVQGHGVMWDPGSGYRHQLAIGSKSDDPDSDTRLYNGWSSQENKFSNILGTVSADWFLTGACQSMNPDSGSVPMSTVATDVYDEVLERVHGVGGMWKGATWWNYINNYDNDRFWTELDAPNPISEAWIDTMYRQDIGSYGRRPRLLTRENCDCTNTSTCTSYMYNDKFGDLLPDKPENLTGYNYLCVRWKDNTQSVSNQWQVLSLPGSTSPEESNAMITAKTTAVKIDDFITAVNFDNESAEEYISDENHTRLQNKESMLFFSQKRMRLEKSREIVSFLSTEKSDLENETDIKEARELAERLSSVPKVLDGVVYDKSRSMIKDAEGEYQDLSVIINRVQYVFKPLVDGKPVENAVLNISFDQKGLYEVQSINFPKTIVEGKEAIEITAALVAQKVGEHDKDGVYDVQAVEEEYKKEMAFYIIDEKGLIRPAYMIERKENLIETIYLD